MSCDSLVHKSEKIITLWLLVVTLPWILAATRSSQSKGIAASRASIEDHLRRELEATAKRFLVIIEKGDPKEFPLLCSRKGVVFGIDQPEISLAAIRRQIDKKEGVYCLLFDTDCLRKDDAVLWGKEGPPARTEPLYSYREIFRKTLPRELNASVSRISGVWSGYVTLALKRQPVIQSGQVEKPLEFEFVYEKRQWKLVAIPYY